MASPVKPGYKRFDAMKTIHTVAIGLFLLLTTYACTPKMTFVTSSIVPSATGTVKVKKDKNKNYIINVSVLNLAEPNKLTPSKNTYLVWMRSNENSAKKLGLLAPSGKALKGNLSATAIDRPDDVFITAEDDADINYPRGDVILTTRR